MAWLQVHQTLKDHRKLFDAADELEITPPHMMGLLVSFWLWALDNAPKGDLAGMTKELTIARILEKYKKQDPATLTRQEYDEICNSLDAAAAQHNQQGGQG